MASGWWGDLVVRMGFWDDCGYLIHVYRLDRCAFMRIAQQLWVAQVFADDAGEGADEIAMPR